MYHKMFHQFMNLEAPPDGPGSGGVKEDSLEQDLADLGETPPDDDDAGDDDDDKEGDDKDDKSDDDDSDDDASDDDKDDEEKDDEEEEKDEKDDEEDDQEDEKPVKADASFKDIKTKYPNLFKEFPQLKSAFFLTPKFLEIFADPESAEEAANRANMLDGIENTFVGQADPKPLFETIHANNPAAFKKIVNNLGETIRGIDQDLYIQFSAPIIEELVYYASKHGERTNDKNLRLAARHISNFFFANGGEIPDITARAKTGKTNEPSDAEKTLEKERGEYRMEKFQNALVEVTEATNKDLSRIIDNKLDKLTSFERKTVIKETRAAVDEQLKNDKAFQKTMKTLWEKSAQSGHSSESKSRIKRAYLERARTIAPGIRNRLRQEAVAARTPGSGEQKDKKGEKRQFGNNGSNTHGRSSRVLDPKKIDWKTTSDLDLLK